jgi:acetoin utilization deacetylase AcuC-like enzyme
LTRDGLAPGERSAMSAPLYFSHPACLEHDPRLLSPGHPDTPERLIALERALAERDWLGWERRPAPAVEPELLALVHSREHVASIRDLCAAGGGAIDADTLVGAPSYKAALHAAGGALEMARVLLAGEAPVGFCGVRPSGHHAERDRAMGFCLFDNVAVAAAGAIAELGVTRVFVLDWDVHHGNGTQEIFRERGDVLFASLHQSPLYPGTGALEDIGSGAGEGTTINLPVPPHTREPLWMALLERIALAAAEQFEPQLILVSAGFDAHERDPLAQCELQTSSFVQMARCVRELAARTGAALGVVLEGGYNRQALAECVCAVLPALAGAGAGERSFGAASDTRSGGAPAPGTPARAASGEDPLLAAALAVHGRHWSLS